MIKAIIFDLGGVLIDLDIHDLEARLKASLQSQGLPPAALPRIKVSSASLFSGFVNRVWILTA